MLTPSLITWANFLLKPKKKKMVGNLGRNHFHNIVLLLIGIRESAIPTSPSRTPRTLLRPPLSPSHLGGAPDRYFNSALTCLFCCFVSKIRLLLRIFITGLCLILSFCFFVMTTLSDLVPQECVLVRWIFYFCWWLFGVSLCVRSFESWNVFCFFHLLWE